MALSKRSAEQQSHRAPARRRLRRAPSCLGQPRAAPPGWGLRGGAPRLLLVRSMLHRSGAGRRGQRGRTCTVSAPGDLSIAQGVRALDASNKVGTAAGGKGAPPCRRTSNSSISNESQHRILAANAFLVADAIICTGWSRG